MFFMYSYNLFFMKRNYKKEDLPTDRIRKFLEPGPIVLVSSCYKNEINIMTMGWYTVMEFNPALIGCIIASSNHSYNLIKKSRQCVINIPTADMIDTVVGIGNSTGGEINKFKKFKLTAEDASTVKAPLIRECYAHFECQLKDDHLLDEYNFFIFEVKKAQAAVFPKYPRTVHYRGEGVFMISGTHIALPGKFRPENL
jgi:flavin reductase (DIM6/NTAB) family NADH-FMN oxidoreductase RutF